MTCLFNWNYEGVARTAWVNIEERNPMFTSSENVCRYLAPDDPSEQCRFRHRSAILLQRINATGRPRVLGWCMRVGVDVAPKAGNAADGFHHLLSSL